MATPTWDCNNNTCSDPGTGNGAYASLAEAYASLAACQAACQVAATWDCDGQGNCLDPGTGLGTFASQSACQSLCIANAIDEEIVGLLIYPNPAKNTLTIDGDYTSATIYDVFGKVALTTDYQKTIDVLALSSGVYFIHITTNDTIIIKKITIAK